jgi:hypothetical protein
MRAWNGSTMHRSSMDALPAELQASILLEASRRNFVVTKSMVRRAGGWRAFAPLLDASIAANRARAAPVTVSLEGSFDHAAVLGKFANLTGLVCEQGERVNWGEAESREFLLQGCASWPFLF